VKSKPGRYCCDGRGMREQTQKQKRPLNKAAVFEKRWRFLERNLSLIFVGLCLHNVNGLITFRATRNFKLHGLTFF
jgi:hypothetical protein